MDAWDKRPCLLVSLPFGVGGSIAVDVGGGNLEGGSCLLITYGFLRRQGMVEMV